MPFQLKSGAFVDGKEIPQKYTGEGADISPPLEWTGAPKDTQEFALICDDPDAPGNEPWIHWIFYSIPASIRSVPEKVPTDEPERLVARSAQGRNSWNRMGYGGPLPPVGHGWHHYSFKLYALGKPLNLKPGATKGELLKAMEGHVLSEATLIGKYQRH